MDAGGPIEAGERVALLDVVRGVAMLGILPVNIVFFAHPQTTFMSHGRAATAPAGDLVAFHVMRFFFQFKFVTLFAVLFGAGLAISKLRSRAAGRDPRAVLARRLVFGWVLGIAHCVLLWWGDILSLYAPLGLALFWSWVFDPRPRTLAGLGVLSMAVFVLVTVALGALLLVIGSDPDVARLLSLVEGLGRADPGAARPNVTGTWDEFFSAFLQPGFETAVFQEGSYVRICAYRAILCAGQTLGLILTGWHLAGLFLVGMAFAKDGLLTRPDDNLPRFRRLGARGLVIGLVAQAVASWTAWTGAGGLAGVLLGEACQTVAGLGLAAAYASGLALFLARPGAGERLAPLGAVGRTAFSNYILQSLVCGLVFYPYGLGLYGRVSLPWLWLVVLGTWSLELVVSPLWLRRFHMGPLEWVWRCVSYGAAPRLLR